MRGIPNNCADESHSKTTPVNINARIERRLDTQHSETQYGFVAKKSTHDAIALLKTVVQRLLNAGCEVHACFIDYEKAFDRVKHPEQIRILQKYNIDNKDLQIIKEIYLEQFANVRLKDEASTEKRPINKGIRQGCPLSPRLFNIYAKEIARNAMIDNAGIRINRHTIGSISYANDKVLFVRTKGELQMMVNRLNIRGKKLGMKINVKKIEVMTFTRTPSI